MVLSIRDAQRFPAPSRPEDVLELIESCRCALQYIESPLDARAIVDRTKAVAYLAEKSRQSREVQNQAAEVALRAQREAGLVTASLEKQHPGTPSEGDLLRTARSKSEELADAGISTQEASRWERVAKLDDITFESYIVETQANGRELTTAGALALANVGIMGTSDGIEWYTPGKYIEAARRVMGDIDLDPASNEQANAVVGAGTYYTQETNGLDKRWFGRVFMNPPFGDIGPVFVQKLLDAYHAADVEQAVLLCAARIETRWFQPLLDHLICIPDHRVSYYTSAGQPGAPAFASCFTYVGPNEDAFIREFSGFGPVLRRVDRG